MNHKIIKTLDELKAAQAAGLRVECLQNHKWYEMAGPAETIWSVWNGFQLRGEVRDGPSGIDKFSGIGELPENLSPEQREAFAMRYICNWCPDVVKDYVGTLRATQRYPDEVVEALVEAAKEMLPVLDAYAPNGPITRKFRAALANLEPKP